MKKTTVLFVCEHNSARSQMAEAFLNSLAGERFHAESAGVEPGKLNPLVVKAMQEANIDISGNHTKAVWDLYKSGNRYDYVVTVCDEAAGEKCPIFPGTTARLAWNFEDPSKLTGNDEQKLKSIESIRDEIKVKVLKFIEVFNPSK